ncbi:MAG: hypothetical protein ACYDDO_14620 [Acidiferrobacterales bacterium]
MTTRLMGPGLVAWFTRGAAKVMCMFPEFTKKPTASVANTSGACGLSRKLTVGEAVCFVMNNTPNADLWNSDDGFNTWTLVVKNKQDNI